MPRSTKLNETMRAAAHESILASAMKLFAQNGYAHTSTRAIAAEAGISAGLMYHYFDSKETLLRAVFDHCMIVLSTAFTQAYTASPAAQRLAQLLQTIFEILARDPSFWALFYMLRTQPAIMRILGDDFRLWTVRLRDIFETELTQAGRENPRLDALLLYSLVEGTIQQYLLDPANYPLEVISRQIIIQYTHPTPRGT